MTLQYKYNAFGSHIQSNNQTTNQVQAYLIDLTSAYDDILAAYTDGVEVASYTYGLTRLHEQLAIGDVHTYSYDHLGSVIGVQDEQGIVIGDYKYDAFGVLVVAHDGSENDNQRIVNFAYTGYPAEPTGLYFANARYYAPEIGRFISEDTYEGEMRNPLSLNRYVYVENNPLRYVDPSGHVKSGDIFLPSSHNKSIEPYTLSWEEAQRQVKT